MTTKVFYSFLFRTEVFPRVRLGHLVTTTVYEDSQSYQPTSSRGECALENYKWVGVIGTVPYVVLFEVVLWDCSALTRTSGLVTRFLDVSVDTLSSTHSMAYAAQNRVGRHLL